MADFLYFTDRITTQIQPDDLRDLKLADVFDQHPASRTVGEGPNGKAGVIFGGDDPQRSIGYFSDRQTWFEWDGYWIGWQNDAKPTAQDLVRLESHDGQLIKLADDQEWLIPKVRLFPGGTNLPMSLIKDFRSGELRGQILSAYTDLWQRTCAIFDTIMGTTESGNVSVPEAWLTCVLGLSLNYHINEAGVSALQLLDTHSYKKVLLAMIDWETIKEHAARLSKKNDSPDPVTSSSGPGA